MYCLTMASILGHQTRNCKAASVFRTPRCAPNKLSWNSSNSYSRKPPVAGITNYSTPLETRYTRDVLPYWRSTNSTSVLAAFTSIGDSSPSLSSYWARYTRFNQDGSQIKVYKSARLLKASGTTASIPLRYSSSSLNLDNFSYQRTCRGLRLG